MSGKILVTGGAGFIGSHTVVELSNSGYEPVILDDFRNSEKSVLLGLKNILKRDVKCYNANCCEADTVEKIFDKEQFNGVIHFAAFKSVNESLKIPVQYYYNNIVSLLVLIEAMRKFNVHEFVFSSSCTVYGQPEELPVTESSPFKEAFSPYGSTKQISEKILIDAFKSNLPLRTMSLRYFNPIGAHPSGEIGELPIGYPNNLVPYLTQSAAGVRGPLTVFGNDYNTPDGTCIRDYIHVVDLAKAHVKSLGYLAGVKEESTFEAFNVGTGNGTSVLELIHSFENANVIKLNYDIGPRRPGDAESIYANCDKAKKQLGWETSLTLEDALRDAWNWQKRLSNNK